jgi:DNA-binding IscR family transcriptional regulator
MSQLTLSFDRPLSRRTDPATSHRAADRSSEFRAKHRALIWNALLEHGPMTYREIAEITRLEPVAVNRRGKEMQDGGLVQIGPDTKDGMRLWRVKR